MVSSLNFLSLAVFTVLQWCHVAVNSVKTCPSGHYLQADRCVGCPKGHYCYKGASPVLCPPGKVSYGSVSDRDSCKICPSGSYQDKSGQRECMWCPDGHFCPKLPEFRPSACPTGYRSYRSVYDREKCSPCPSGYYQDKKGQADCMPCPAGHYCPALPESKPVPCPPGTRSYSSVYDRTNCVTCYTGYFQDKIGQEECLPCPDGHYCFKPENRPQACPPGHISWGDVRYRTSCNQCPTGYFQDKSGQKNCIECPDGHHCATPENRPQACPPGHVSPHYGPAAVYRMSCRQCSTGYFQDKSGQIDCIICPDGHYCATPESRPRPCPSGYRSRYRVSDRYKCSQCSEGQCTTPVQPMVPCNPGSVAHDNSKCAPCTFDTYQDQSGQTVCKACPDGHYCLTSSVAPVQCPPGSYSTKEITNRTNCLPCSNGKYQHQAGQQLCLTCPDGHYCPNAAAPPTRCPVGTYSTTAMQDRLVCATCPNGTYQDETGQRQCKTCPTGHFCRTPDISPIQCPPGTFSTTDTLIRTACLPCPPGTYQDQCGQSTCKTCPSGHCPNLWAAAVCPSLNSFNRIPAFCTSSSSCPSLREMSNASAVCITPSTPNRYSGQPVQSVIGNNNVTYQVVAILPEHRTKTNVHDTTITTSTAQAFDLMASAAKMNGVDIRIESGFRSPARQVELWECFVTKRCKHEAAKPGKSEHGAGIALDLNTQCDKQRGNRAPKLCASSAVYVWLLNNAHNFGFKRTVLSEPHHWEYVGRNFDGPVDFAKFE